MQKYPDEILILEPVGDINNPYDGGKYVARYRGKCRCFQKDPTALRLNEVKNSTHRVVIPDRNMIEVGENWRVGVHMHTNPGPKKWDLIGYVKDFARYDRVCNLDFEMAKEELVYEDIPSPTQDVTKRQLNSSVLGDFTIEGTNVLPDGLVIAKSEFLTVKGPYDTKICTKETEQDEDGNETQVYVIVPENDYLDKSGTWDSRICWNTPSHEDEEDRDDANHYYLCVFKSGYSEETYMGSIEERFKVNGEIDKEVMITIVENK